MSSFKGKADVSGNPNSTEFLFPYCFLLKKIGVFLKGIM